MNICGRYVLVVFGVVCALALIGGSEAAETQVLPWQGMDELEHRPTWLGNDYEYGPDVMTISGHTPHNIHDIWVLADGTVFTNVPWEERGGNVIAFKQGEWVLDVRTGNSGGGRTITATADYLYLAGDEYRHAEEGIDRRDLDDVADHDTNVHMSCGIVHGLAATAKRVYATVPKEDVVKVFDADLTPVGQWKLENGGEMCLDGEGHLWIVQADRSRVVRYTRDGTKLPQKITLAENAVPTDVAIDNQGRLMVADAGPAEQIHFYRDIDSNPRLDEHFGVKGGVFTGDEGRIGPGRLFDPRGVGMDADGNLYVASQPGMNGSTMIQSYAPDGTLRWERECHVWIDAPAIHPENESLVYSSDAKMRVDWSAPEGQGWEATAVTLNPHRFPEDPRAARGHGAAGGTYLRKLPNGRVYQYETDMNSDTISIFRFTEKHDHIAVPCGYGRQGAVWVDSDGDGEADEEEVTEQETGVSRGMTVDSEGTIWMPTQKKGIFRYTLQGFTGEGVPRYSVESRQHFDMPEPFTKLRRLHFYPGKGNMMLLNGFTEEHPDLEHHWKRAGKVIHRYDEWQPGHWNLRWSLTVPSEDVSGGNGGDGNVQVIDVAGKYLFLARNGSSKNLKVERGHVDVRRLDSGEYVGWMEPPEWWGPIGIIDVTVGMKAYRLSDGTYVIMLEDDGMSKTVVYRWRPPTD